jgi:hypothetical protein
MARARQSGRPLLRAGELALGFQAAGAEMCAIVDASEVAGSTLLTIFTRLQLGRAQRVLCGTRATSRTSISRP